MLEAAAVTELRLAIHRIGWRPVPVTGPQVTRTDSPGKAPLLRAWQTVCLEADEAEIESWQARLADHTNTGILCGEIVGLDLDILDDKLAALIEVHARDRLGDTPLRRVGLAPKRLLVFRADGAFGKLSGARFLAAGKPARIEVLAAGQHFTAFGGHPSGCEYAWTGDSPLEMTPGDLPTVTQAQVAAFIAEAEIIMRRNGAVQEKPERDPWSAPARPGNGVRESASRRPLPGLAKVRSALASFPNDLAYDAWVKLGLALYRATAGSADGQALWDEFSRQWPENTPEAIGAKWRSFASPPPADRPGVTEATLFALAIEHGWRDEGRSDRPEAPPEPLRFDPVTGEIKHLIEPVVTYDPGSEPPQVLRGIIAAGQAVALIGGPGCGKTSLACLLAACVAAGAPFLGIRTEQGAVAYVGAESPSSARKRITAACMELSLRPEDLPIGIIPQAVPLLDAKSANLIIEEARYLMAQRPAARLQLLIIDTYARCMIGADENDAGESGAAIATLERVAKELGCAVLILHHPSKADPKTGRGSGAIKGGLDAEIIVEREPGMAGNGTLSVGKENRDLEPFQPIGFMLKPVDLGPDPDGAMVSTVVAVATAEDAPFRRATLRGAAKECYDDLVDTIARVGTVLPAHLKLPANTTGTSQSEWRNRFYERYILSSDGARPEQARQAAFRRQATYLKQAGHVGIYKQFVWLIK